MDRGKLSEAIIQEVGTVVMSAVQEAAPEVLTADLDGIERRLHAGARQVLGRVLEPIVAVGATPPGAPGARPPCPAC
jgi:hypothetical protein